MNPVSPKKWVAALVLAHVIKMLFYFKGVHWSSPFPIVNYDFILYYSRALRAHEFFLRSGRFWGYDPFHMAGYVSGPVHEVGNYLTSLVAHFLSPWVSIAHTLLILEIVGL